MVLIILNMIMMMISHDGQSQTITITLHILFCIRKCEYDTEIFRAGFIEAVCQSLQCLTLLFSYIDFSCAITIAKCSMILRTGSA